MTGIATARASRPHLVATASGLAGLGLAAFVAAQAPAAPEQPKTAGEAFKNVQVLKDVPADQLFPAMQFIAASLGVECDHCHVARAPEKDDKDAKKTARKMMQMMASINEGSFRGAREVTCYSCHRGALTPATIPAVAVAETAPAHPPTSGTAAAKATPAPPPSPDQVLERYVQAMGGAAAISKVTSRVQKGTMTGFGPGESAVVVYGKAPSKRASVVMTPRGESITAFDGSQGWMSGRGGAHPMSAAESAAAALDADLHFPLHVKQRFPDLSVAEPEIVDGRSATVLLAGRGDEPPVKLCFDAESGRLVRTVRYAETPLGLNPTQIDYADYRAVDGVQVPFRWTVARPGGAFTIQVQETQHNVPVDDSRFVMPVQPPPAEEQRRPA